VAHGPLNKPIDSAGYRTSNWTN